MMKTLLILSLLTIKLSAAQEFKSACDLWIDLPDAQYLELSKFKDKKIRELANMRTFSKVADKILNQLSEKPGNPDLMKWADQSSTALTDKAKVVSLWREHFFISIMTGSFKNLKKFEKAVLTKNFQEINKKALPYKKKMDLTLRFIEAKTLSLKFIDSTNFDKKTKTYLKDRIASIRMEWFTQIEGTRYEKSPIEYIKRDINYDPLTHSMILGFQVTRFKDPDTVTSVFAEQIAHAFDPCRWNSFQRNKKFPFQKITQCLRTKNSITAKKRGDEKLSTKKGKKILNVNQVKILKENPLCNTPFFPLEYDQREQINTAFADWFSAEVMSQKEKLSDHMREDLCGVTAAAPFLAHPSGTDRLIRIYMANPKIRKKMGIEIDKKIKYCSLK